MDVEQDQDTDVGVENTNVNVNENTNENTNVIQQEQEQEAEAERLEREKRQILEQREENKQLAKFAEQEWTLQEERLRASVLTRAKWWVFGRDAE